MTSNARLRLAFARGLISEVQGHKLGQPPGFPRPLPLVRYADKALCAFPTPVHAHGQDGGP